MNAEIRIDQLNLAGIHPADRRRVADAFHRELTRLIEARGLSGLAKSALTSLSLPPIATSPGVPADRVGERAARELYRRLRGGLTRGGRP